MSDEASGLAAAHHRRRMGGRDPHERHRTATPLELLFDLTYVVAFGTAGNQVAHLVAEGHYRAGLVGFAIAVFAICWAWINYSWFASAYDTDDWVFRVATMVQMVGVVVLALGLPAMFQSLDEGGDVDNSIMVLGYVVMRASMIFLWLRAAGQDPERRAVCWTYARWVAAAQVGWVLVIVLDTPLTLFLLALVVLVPLEAAGPLLAERKAGGTPWHAHHIAERYGLLAIITLGEGVIGTVAAVGAIVEAQGWTLDTALVAVAGTGLTFGMWWVYFVVPSGAVLHEHRDRAFPWGYGHVLVFASIAATGAGLHVAAYYVEHEARIGAVATVSSVAIPVGIFVLAVYAIHTWLAAETDPFHVWLLVGTAAVLVLAVVLAAAGVSMAWCLVVLMLAPVVTIVGFETVGHRHLADTLGRRLRQP